MTIAKFGAQPIRGKWYVWVVQDELPIQLIAGPMEETMAKLTAKDLNKTLDELR